MEEACYLDVASLVGYDVPPVWRMTVDERMGTAAPDPPGRPRFYRRSIAPVHVAGRSQSSAPVETVTTFRMEFAGS